MPDSTVDADSLVAGAGATSMAFVDTRLTETDATVVLADRRDRPGGHWNDAYSFVRLHQPAALYGVPSRPLGTDALDTSGTNAGLLGLASGHEVLAHFDVALRERFLPSGRVRWLPMSDVDAATGTVTSLLSGDRTTVRARRVVDGTHARVTVPATHTRGYAVADGVVCVPPGELPRRAPEHDGYVVVGAGKTGMDACLWLLEHGADPDAVTWVVPRDGWLLDREVFQPRLENMERWTRSVADQVEALAAAASVEDCLARLEAAGELLRLDPCVTPTAYHCATVTTAELAALRRIRSVVRLGRLVRAEPGRLVLERGETAVPAGRLVVDCSAAGLPPVPPRPVFDGDRITLQMVRQCQPAFSAALIARVEARVEDADEKNRLCPPIPPPQEPADWVRMMAVELRTRHRWMKHPQVGGWLADCRLDGFTALLGRLPGTETEVLAHLERYGAHVRAAGENAQRLAATCS